MTRLTKYEQGTMKKLDALVNEFPEVYKCIGETDIDKTYSMPKQYVSYRKPRRISEDVRKRRREQMKVINLTDNKSLK